MFIFFQVFLFLAHFKNHLRFFVDACNLKDRCVPQTTFLEYHSLHCHVFVKIRANFKA